MEDLRPCGGGSVYKASTLTAYSASGSPTYTIPCGGTPVGFSLFAVKQYPLYSHIFYCDLASNVLFMNATKYAASSYVTVSGNNIIFNISTLLGEAWEGKAIGFR